MLKTLDILNTKEFGNMRPLTPERDLLVAVLDRAVLDFCGREGELHERAREWIFEEDFSEDPFSFSSICYYLGINQSALRERILELDIPKNVSQAHRWLRTKVQADRAGKRKVRPSAIPSRSRPPAHQHVV